MSTRLLRPVAAASLTLGLHLAAAAADPQPVKRPLDVYVFDGSSKADKADDHIKKAAEIWSKAGITFEPRVEHFKTLPNRPPGRASTISRRHPSAPQRAAWEAATTLRQQYRPASG